MCFTLKYGDRCLFHLDQWYISVVKRWLNKHEHGGRTLKNVRRRIKKIGHKSRLVTKELLPILLVK